LDACHTVKLLRNLWANEKDFHTKGGCACWSYMERLLNYQLEENCNATNKLSQKHIDWEAQPMKVSNIGLKLSKTFHSL
jgi:hypothetical protein